MTGDTLFCDYFKDWVNIFKKGSVREVTLSKYHATIKWLLKNEPNLKINEINKRKYQSIINKYAENHERATVSDFHGTLVASIRDAVDEKFLEYDPTRKVALRGCAPRYKKPKYINRDELKRLIETLDFGDEPSSDWLIFLLTKTGARYSEVAGITPRDFDFQRGNLEINKTLSKTPDKEIFGKTKNESSNRKIKIDIDTIRHFKKLTEGLPRSEPIFQPSGTRLFNSTVNNRLHNLCVQANVPIISLHALRHTHASVLLLSGVSIQSIAKRLGHSDTTTTQKTYLHILKEMEEEDDKKIMEELSGW